MNQLNFNGHVGDESYDYIVDECIMPLHMIHFKMACDKGLPILATNTTIIRIYTNEDGALLAGGYIENYSENLYTVTESGTELYHKITDDIKLIEELMKL